MDRQVARAQLLRQLRTEFVGDCLLILQINQLVSERPVDSLRLGRFFHNLTPVLIGVCELAYL